ncbi:PH domain-containing protein [Streptomyces sp. NPDC091272]|uniref:PH domain-containing protein n=1 Tax=Streptomyces sp. NPDC091272 TaxID=3365981 RepID=UPI0038300847
MTSTGPTSSSGSSGTSGSSGSGGPTVYADRVFRNGANVFWGCLMLAICAWLGIDAVRKGEAMTAWKVLAGLLFVVPLVVAFMLRPAVYAGADRLRIRNPFRTVVLPWASVGAIRTGYSSEVLSNGGTKYQMWAVPVSLRQRKKAVRNQSRAAAADDPRSSRTAFGRPSTDRPQVAASDQIVRDLQNLAETSSTRPGAQGEPSVRWAYEILVPCGVGLVTLIVLLAR